MKMVYGKLIIIVMSAALFFSACSHSLGYSIVLWSIPERNISDGDLVRVYIKSNINKVYVVGVPHAQEKFEIPQWQILPPSSKRKIAQSYAAMADYQHIYAHVTLDGLPVRFEDVNTSRQVYRLRKNEVVKVLYKGKTETISSGSKTLDGEWVRIMTQDGTTGWCFSYNLKLFDETKESIEKSEMRNAEDDVESLLAKEWVPDSYQSMIANNRIDLQLMRANYLFDSGITTGTVKLYTPDISVTYPYQGFTKLNSGIYSLDETPITIMVRADNNLSIQFVDTRGMPTAFSFVVLDKPIAEIIALEQARRTGLYNRILEQSNFFVSENFGELQFLADKTFIWEGYSSLIPSIIPENALGKGKIDFTLFLEGKLANEYDGVLSFEFENATKPVHFLYTLEQTGIKLESIEGAVIHNNIVMEQTITPLTIFFEAL